MTTSVNITNNGPQKIRVRLRNISKSARTNDSDAATEVTLDKGEGVTGLHVYDTRKLIIEEIEP